MALISGRAALSADSVVGPSGKKIRVWSVSLISGGSAGELILRNGTTASGTLEFELTGTANAGTHQSFETGRLFPDGCFYDHNGNNTIAVISYTVDS